MTDNTENSQTANTTGQQPEFMIQRVYVKDISYEAPQTPGMFQQDWKPDVDVQMQTQSTPLAEDTYEIVLKVTITVKNNDKIAFIAEVAQAGIFTLRHFTPAQMSHGLGSLCPSILFPYARETITDLSTRGTFPPLYLAPINFDHAYMQRVQQEQQSGNKIVTPDSVAH